MIHDKVSAKYISLMTYFKILWVLSPVTVHQIKYSTESKQKAAGFVFHSRTSAWKYPWKTRCKGKIALKWKLIQFFNQTSQWWQNPSSYLSAASEMMQPITSFTKFVKSFSCPFLSLYIQQPLQKQSVEPENSFSSSVRREELKTEENFSFFVSLNDNRMTGKQWGNFLFFFWDNKRWSLNFFQEFRRKHFSLFFVMYYKAILMWPRKNDEKRKTWDV